MLHKDSLYYAVAVAAVVYDIVAVKMYLWILLAA